MKNILTDDQMKELRKFKYSRDYSGADIAKMWNTIDHIKSELDRLTTPSAPAADAGTTPLDMAAADAALGFDKAPPSASPAEADDRVSMDDIERDIIKPWLEKIAPHIRNRIEHRHITWLLEGLIHYGPFHNRSLRAGALAPDRQKLASIIDMQSWMGKTGWEIAGIILAADVFVPVPSEDDLAAWLCGRYSQSAAGEFEARDHTGKRPWRQDSKDLCAALLKPRSQS